MATNRDVASAWGQSLRLATKNMSSNGSELYSYDLMIGYTTKEGGKVLIDYTQGGGRFVSMTTSGKHIAPSRIYADFTVTPDQYDEHGKNAELNLAPNPPLMDEPSLSPHHLINGGD